MRGEPPMHLCLLAHGLTVPSSGPPLAHPELFIPLADVDELLGQLADEHFQFVLPGDAAPEARRTCSFTFDDGYANNALFLTLAAKYALPFVLFVSSINIAEQLPFLWDAASLARTRWRHWADDYRQAYRDLDPHAARRLLGDENHRPFTPEELRAFSGDRWTHLALHTHSHQPLVGRFLARAAQELEENVRFLSQFPRVLLRDLALPCGLYTPLTARRLLNGLVDRIYTTVGGGATRAGPIVHRISLISPGIGGSLMSQIETSFSWKVKLRRQIAIFRYSASPLNRL